jgi:glycerol-3-phosphate acyltransferase PlsY
MMIEPAIYYPILAYLLGSIPFAVPVSKVFGLPSPYSYGSGNPGATNVLRTGGRKGKIASAITLLCDATKGTLAVTLASSLQPSLAILASVVLAVFLGHLYPIFYRFKGGKGVATAAGILWALDWRMGAAVTLIWVGIAKFLRISSLAALCAALLAPCIAFYIWAKDFRTAAVIVMCVFLLWRHRSNIQRLLNGEESAFKQAR